MGARERWYYIDENKMLHEVEENDGATFLRSGAERIDIVLCGLEEAKTKYPDQLRRALRSD
jgi:hypothetical protein